MNSKNIVFETKRLIIRKADASKADIDMFYRLWNNPTVMKNVGYPNGLGVTKKGLLKQFKKQKNSEFNAILIVQIKNSKTMVGECKLGALDSKGVSETDVKLFPKFWGKGYGKEIKQGLIDYLFKNTKCRAVKATPNELNIASQKMQKSVGGKKVGEGINKWKDKAGNPIELKYYIYKVFKSDWKKKKMNRKLDSSANASE